MNNYRHYNTLREAEAFFESLGKVPAKLISRDDICGYRVEWNEETDYGY